MITETELDIIGSTTSIPVMADDGVSKVAVVYSVIGCMAILSVILGLIAFLVERKRSRQKRGWHHDVDEKAREEMEMAPPIVKTHMLLASHHSPKSDDNKNNLEPIKEEGI